MKTRRNILTAVLMLSVVACRNDESWTNAEKRVSYRVMAKLCAC